MRTPNFAEVTAFITIADRRSFARAAKELGMAPSTLSQMIRGLEERLGIRLLNRTTRSVAPTEAGERLLSQLRPLLDDYAQILESLNAFRDKPAGSLRLTVPPPAASFVLAPRLAAFLQQYPEINLEISVDSGLVDIVAARFDAGIRIGERVERDMIAVRISDAVKFAVVAAPDYLAQHGTPETPYELQKHRCVRTRFSSNVLSPWRFAENGRVFEVEVHGPLITNDIDLAIRAAITGVGLCHLTTDYAARFVADGRLVTVLEEWMPPGASGFFLYYPSRRQTPAALQALIAFLRQDPQHPRRPPAVSSSQDEKRPG